MHVPDLHKIQDTVCFNSLAVQKEEKDAKEPTPAEVAADTPPKKEGKKGKEKGRYS